MHLLILSVGLLILVGLQACNKEELIELEPPSIQKTVEMLYSPQSTLKREFGRALLYSMHESRELRLLIRQEALKMFNKDYEVLYLTIKDVQLGSGLTVEQLLQKHIVNLEIFDKALSEFPTLTILVPELPESSFSAEIWDAANIVPAVAIRTNEHNDVPIIHNNFVESVVLADSIPAYPVVVVKNNERLIADTHNNAAYFNSVKTRIVYQDERVKIKFWASQFDQSLAQISENKRLAPDLDQVILDAAEIYDNADGWHRDYIYYGIQPSSPNGQFNYDFKEHITTFEMLGDGWSAYRRLSDQTEEPIVRRYVQDRSRSSAATHWTDGFYEFKFKNLINSTNGVGEELITGASINPEELFYTDYARSSTGNYYYFTGLRPQTAYISVPIINWLLEEYASSMKIEVEEVDMTVRTTTTDTRSVKFANNFSINPTFGLLEKVGLKFGASRETNRSATIEKSFTQGNDELRSAIVNFADDVYIEDLVISLPFGNPVATPITRSYSTGLCEFSVEPIRVQ